MKKTICFIVMLLIAPSLMAGTIDVATGFGYFKDADNHVVCRARLPQGTHPIKDGCTYTEVASQQEMEAIEIYVVPKTLTELNEDKIRARIASTERAAAITALKASGDLPQNYKDN